MDTGIENMQWHPAGPDAEREQKKKVRERWINKPTEFQSLMIFTHTQLTHNVRMCLVMGFWSLTLSEISQKLNHMVKILKFIELHEHFTAAREEEIKSLKLNILCKKKNLFLLS